MALNDLTNKNVDIEWVDPSNDWSTFSVLEVDRGWIRLIGRPDSDGNVWEGKPFWCKLDSIDTIWET